MQSTVAMRGGVRDVTEEQLEREVTSLMGLEGKLESDDDVDVNDDNDDDNHDFLDDNDLERILSRTAIAKRKIDLFEAPEFVKRLSSYQEANVGDAVTFSGQYRAFPKPTVKWYKDEEEVKETKRHNLDLSSEWEGIVRLIIQEVVQKDEGAYKCKVENQEGVASTTGYLSVSGKPTDKSLSLQSKKLTQDRVSTPPYLRPIAEQKSVEEREEKEYQCLPPSPLQEFMDKIRHSAKSMHGPIVYADLADVYPDEDVLRDFNEETLQDEEDVFDDERGGALTPSISPTEEIAAENLLRQQPPREKSRAGADAAPNRNGLSIRVVDEFISPSVDLNAAPLTTSKRRSNEDGTYDSDGPENQGPTQNEASMQSTGLHPNGGVRRNRGLKLTLQRSQAVEICDSDNNSIAGASSATLKQPYYTENDRETSSLNDDEKVLQEPQQHDSEGSGKQQLSEVNDSNRVSLSAVQTRSSELRQEIDSEIALDVLLGWIDSPIVQLFVGFIASCTSVALATDVPTVYLIAVVIMFSFISFILHDRRPKTE